jgi:Asp/Glu/hydantoin racemase
MLYTARKGQDYYGFPVGVVAMECFIPYPPGSPMNPRTFDFPVIHASVPGATMDALIYNPQTELLRDRFIQAGEQLVRQGVKAVFGGCGFMILFQKELSEALPVPVYSSSLLQLPMINQSLKKDQTIGIISASGVSLTPKHMEIACNGMEIPYVIHGLENRPAFKAAIHDQVGTLDSDAVEADVVAEALLMQQQHPNLGAILLECTDLPPYAKAVNQATGLPVYDITTLINWGYSAVEPKDYHH